VTPWLRRMRFSGTTLRYRRTDPRYHSGLWLAPLAIILAGLFLFLGAL
jgi:hypothetical protein